MIKSIYGLGIINDIYYCGYKNIDTLKEEIYSINLKNNICTSICELPIGYNIAPRLYDNKILYVVTNESDSQYLLLGYYDLNTNEEKIAFDKTSILIIIANYMIIWITMIVFIMMAIFICGILKLL